MFEVKNRSKDYIKSANDYYITPRLAVDDILKVEKIELGDTILDAGVGNGAIANVLIEQGHKVDGIDLVDRGFPNVILTDIKDFNKKYDVVISNPPYGRGIVNDFVEKCLQLANKKLIIFCRWQLLETMTRYEKLFNQKGFKVANIYLHSNRVACENPEMPNASKSMMNYAWFVWDKDFNGKPTLNWIDAERIKNEN